MITKPDEVMSNTQDNIHQNNNQVVNDHNPSAPVAPPLPPNLQRAVEVCPCAAVCSPQYNNNNNKSHHITQLYLQDAEFAVFIDRALAMWDEEEDDPPNHLAHAGDYKMYT